MASIHEEIEKRIKKRPAGTILFPQDFRALGSDTAIKMALSRLTTEGLIDRAANGIYVKPKTDTLLGRIPPSMEEIAQAIARRDHINIKPAGAYALHKLGLSTQIPMKLVYDTDGAPRTINVGKGVIRFKRATPKKLATKGKISSLVIQALDSLGKDGVTEDIKKYIYKLLANENPAILRQDALIAPAWIANILNASLEKNGRMVKSPD